MPERSTPCASSRIGRRRSGDGNLDQRILFRRGADKAPERIQRVRHLLRRAFLEDKARHKAGRIINIHPSLLPQFAGTMDAVTMALEAHVAETGCTVHVVTKDVDAGPILAQRSVEVRPDDTVETLRDRIQAEEHSLLPEVVKRIAGQALPLTV